MTTDCEVLLTGAALGQTQHRCANCQGPSSIDTRLCSQQYKWQLHLTDCCSQPGVIQLMGRCERVRGLALDLVCGYLFLDSCGQLRQFVPVENFLPTVAVWVLEDGLNRLCVAYIISAQPCL